MMEAENGVYRWRGRVGKAYRVNVTKVVLCTCGGISALLIAFAAMLDMELMPLTLLCCGIAMLIAIVVCLLQGKNTEQWECYEMREEGILSGVRRNASWMAFRDVLYVGTGDGIIELQGRHRKMTVFVPPEDFDFVRDYIAKRVEDAGKARL